MKVIDTHSPNKLHIYMDDVASSVIDEDQAVQATKQLLDLFLKGGFQLAKWSSNSTAVLKEIPKELHLSQSVTFDDDTTLKILGLRWYSGEDVFKFKMEIEALTEKPDEAYADREQFESQFFVLVSTARLLLSPTVHSSGGRPGPGSTASTSCGAARQDFVRLPKLDLPHFDGNYQHWLGFRDTPTETSGLLSSALVHVSDANGVLRDARLLLDNGSASNFVTQDLCRQLGLATRSAGATITGINEQSSHCPESESCDITIHSLHSNYTTTVKINLCPLSSALVYVSDANGVLRDARLLLDNGSASNFVTQDLCRQLGLATRSAGATITVKALHLELVTSLTTESFLAALRRFMSRRGKPQTLYCDNGTSFVGASNELTNFLKQNHDKLQSGMAENLINFKFSPAYSPHFGGLWEAAVKSTKYHFKRILSLTHLTYEELNCCLIQIEAFLSSRPLTPLSSDPSDLTYLSPSHFLIGRSLLSVPEKPLTEEYITRLERFQIVEKLKQHFWSRFSNEYVTLLQQKTKWHTSTDQLQVGTMVLVKDRALPPLLWLLGRVTKLYPGTDNVTRVADIRTKKGVIRRAYNNLCPLPIT
ncbi:uncharacterized protein LOC134754762 [Cydia strobilella]|uniref:uncharacterized protein LOC134754762 n=1 Tax=Cydia strobilella TaxID=1100964 RepID=UPI0030060DBA